MDKSMFVGVLVILLAVNPTLQRPSKREEADEKCREVCRRQPVDIGFVIDTSVSVAESDFELGLWFVRDLISLYEVGPNGARVAAVTFADKNYEHFDLDSYIDQTTLTDAVVHLRWMHGTRTNTGDGIDHMTAHLAEHGRDGVDHVMIVITDGNSQEGHLTASAAERAREQGIEMFAVGVGPSVSAQELENIAGENDHVFTVKSYDLLDTIKSSLAYRTCGEVPVPEVVCRDNPLDISFVIDASTSIGETDFRIGKNFVKEFVSTFTIGPNSVLVSAVTFSNHSNPEDAFGFGDNNDQHGVAEALDRLAWKTGNTNTGAGIDYMRINHMSQRRPDAGHVCIVMTDGNSQNGSKTKKAAKAARDDAITMFAIGIGHGVQDTELENIAGSTERVFKVDDYASLDNIKSDLDAKTCTSAMRLLGHNLD